MLNKSNVLGLNRNNVLLLNKNNALFLNWSNVMIFNKDNVLLLKTSNVLFLEQDKYVVFVNKSNVRVLADNLFNMCFFLYPYAHFPCCHLACTAICDKIYVHIYRPI